MIKILILLQFTQANNLHLEYLGLKNYNAQSHSGRMLASIHDHANNIRTVGLGELNVVLNGVEFRTRHNDYRLVMPHRTSSEYHKVQEIPFPGKTFHFYLIYALPRNVT